MHIKYSIFLLFGFVQLSLSAQKSFKVITKVVDAYPVLSPDGSKIVFMSNRTGKFQIFTCNLNGENLNQLTNSEGDNETPVWSPKGDKIVFASTRDGDNEIYLMNSDGTNQRRLTNQPGDDSHPKFSPDGSKIIFNSARTSPDVSAKWLDLYLEIFTMDIDGGNLKQLTSFKTICTYPSMSPDGQKIAFRKIIKSPGLNWSLDSISVNSEVFVMDIDGSNPVNISNNLAYDGWPCWMPDGKRILFTSNRGGKANMGQLYMVNIDGTKLNQVTNPDHSFIQSSISKDGKTIYTQRNWETETYEYGHIVSIPMDE